MWWVGLRAVVRFSDACLASFVGLIAGGVRFVGLIAGGARASEGVFCSSDSTLLEDELEDVPELAALVLANIADTSCFGDLAAALSWDDTELGPSCFIGVTGLTSEDETSSTCFLTEPGVPTSRSGTTDCLPSMRSCTCSLLAAGGITNFRLPGDPEEAVESLRTDAGESFDTDAVESFRTDLNMMCGDGVPPTPDILGGVLLTGASVKSEI